MTINIAVPVLRVSDVARSIDWYQVNLGFADDPFPREPPHKFAILRCGLVELMLRQCKSKNARTPRRYDWDVYLRVDLDSLRKFHEALFAQGLVTRRMERMFYGLAEFEVTDLDGNVLCIGGESSDIDELPTPED